MERDVDQSRMSGGDLSVEYYTRQPSPGQWVAIGTIAGSMLDNVAPVLPSMLVGTGVTEYAAIEQLRARLLELSPTRGEISQPPYVVDWAMTNEIV